MEFRYDVAAICALFGIALWLIYRRDRARKMAIRRAYFDDCRSLFETCRIVQDGTDFPVLDGQYRGHPIRLEPVIDHMAVRKLPSLWLMVSLFGEFPIAGTIDFLMRPQNTEFYSPSADLPISLPIPPDWPQHALLRTDIENSPPPVALLAPSMSFFGDERAKELVVTPRGVRIVYQASQGERAYYMVLRQPEFGDARLPKELALRLLEQVVAVYNSGARVMDGEMNKQTKDGGQGRSGS
jgi:hypothetical protein